MRDPKRPENPQPRGGPGGPGGPSGGPGGHHPPGRLMRDAGPHMMHHGGPGGPGGPDRGGGPRYTPHGGPWGGRESESTSLSHFSTFRFRAENPYSSPLSVSRYQYSGFPREATSYPVYDERGRGYNEPRYGGGGERGFHREHHRDFGRGGGGYGGGGPRGGPRLERFCSGAHGSSLSFFFEKKKRKEQRNFGWSNCCSCLFLFWFFVSSFGFSI